MWESYFPHSSFYLNMKNFFFLVFLIGAVTLSAQSFCERTITGPRYYSGSQLLSFDNNIYYFRGFGETGSENRQIYFYKADYCLQGLDSVKVPLDSGLYRSLAICQKANDKIIGLSITTDYPPYPFDTVASHVKNEIFIYDTNLVLQNRINLKPAMGKYAFQVRMTLLEDSILAVAGSNRNGILGGYLGLFNLQGHVIADTVADSLGFSTDPIGTFNKNDYFFIKGEFILKFQTSPLKILDIDTITTYFQSLQHPIDDIRSSILHPNGFNYIIGTCTNWQKNPPQGDMIIYKFDSAGNQAQNLVYGSNAGGDGLGFDAALVAGNGDLVIASYPERATSQGPIWDMTVTRFDENLNKKWDKTLSLPGISFIPIYSTATPDNGATFLSVITDPNATHSNILYNDLHILHIDSSGYYSPLSTADFGDMLSSAVSIYPNPVRTFFTVQQLEPNETYQAGIYDVNGQLLERMELSLPFEVKVDGLANGTYLLILQGDKGGRITRKFVKE